MCDMFAALSQEALKSKRIITCLPGKGREIKGKKLKNLKTFVNHVRFVQSLYGVRNRILYIMLL